MQDTLRNESDGFSSLAAEITPFNGEKISPQMQKKVCLCVCVCGVFGYGRVMVPFIKLGWNLEPYIIKSQTSWNAK